MYLTDSMCNRTCTNVNTKLTADCYVPDENFIKGNNMSAKQPFIDNLPQKIYYVEKIKNCTLFFHLH
jgi:hypothetical protein